MAIITKGPDRSVYISLRLAKRNKNGKIEPTKKSAAFTVHNVSLEDVRSIVERALSEAEKTR